jgi:hypothetical protein
MKCIPALVLVFFASVAIAQDYAPLPKPLKEAQTVYLQNETNWPKIADKAYKELKSWGRYRVVDDPAEADLVLRFSFNQVAGSSFILMPIGQSVVGGTVSGTGRGEALTLDIFYRPKTGDRPVWSVTKSGTLLVSNNAKDCIKELRKRMPKGKSQK